MVQDPLLALMQVRAFRTLEPGERVLVDVAAAEREREDPSQRHQRPGDRLRGKTARPQLRDQAGAVVGRDLGRPLLAERGEEVLVQVVAVVLERPLAPLARFDLRLEALEPGLGQLGEADPARRRELPQRRLRRQQLPLPARLGQLRPDRLEAGLAGNHHVDAVAAVLLPVDSALDPDSLHLARLLSGTDRALAVRFLLGVAGRRRLRASLLSSRPTVTLARAR